MVVNAEICDNLLVGRSRWLVHTHAHILLLCTSTATPTTTTLHIIITQQSNGGDTSTMDDGRCTMMQITH